MPAAGRWKGSASYGGQACGSSGALLYQGRQDMGEDGMASFYRGKVREGGLASEEGSSVREYQRPSDSLRLN